MRNFQLALALGFFVSACSSPAPQANTDLGTSSPVDFANSSSAVTLTMTSFPVAPGEEVFKYQDFVNPFGGTDAEIAAFESHMTSGSHHLLVFYQPGVTADGPLTGGNGLMFQPTPYGSQQPDLILSYPPGVAAVVPGAQGIRLQAHYLNATANPITAVVSVTFHVAAPGTVTQRAGVFFFINPAIYVPAMTTMTVSKNCPFPLAANLIFATGHMHQHATLFQATTNGTTLYQTTNWAQAPTQALTPPVVTTPGQTISFACTYNNMTTSALTFGESAQTNEMCVLSGQYYPVPAGMNPLIGCQ